MRKKPKSSITYWLGVIVLGLALGLALQFVRAWTEPTAAPPGGNVGAPINTGNIDQAKSAGLALYGNAYGLWANGRNYGIYGKDYDSGTWGALGYGDYGAYASGTLYGLGATGSDYGVAGSDSDSGTWGALGYGGWGGYFHGPAGTDSYMQAPILYDTDATYHVDPNGNSQLYAVYAYAVYADGWFRAQGNTGLYFQDHGGGLYMSDNSWIRSYGNKGIYTGGEIQATTIRGNSNVCIGGDCRESWPSAAVEADTLQAVTDRSNTTTRDIISPKLIDQNNTNYYLDPSDRSNVHHVTTNGQADKGAGTINAAQLCIGGDCRTEWPEGGSTTTCPSCYEMLFGWTCTYIKDASGAVVFMNPGNPSTPYPVAYACNSIITGIYSGLSYICNWGVWLPYP